jgi:hypothetical protein
VFFTSVYGASEADVPKAVEQILALHGIAIGRAALTMPPRP